MINLTNKKEEVLKVLKISKDSKFIKFDKKIKKFLFDHPIISFLAMFIVMPIFILASVVLLTTLVSVPVGLIFGWF
ncbi:MAG: hypothetical protein RSA79_05260 [Oscillospiraceae bacterium]